MSNRQKDNSYGPFLFDNCEELLTLFSNIYKEIDISSLGTFKEEQSKEASFRDDPGPFALKECLQLEYELVQTYQTLGNSFKINGNFLMQRLSFLTTENNQIQFQAIRHISVFILDNDREYEIDKIVQKNKHLLLSFIEEFQLRDGEVDQFSDLKTVLLDKLNELQKKQIPVNRETL